jgi:hypothetical protein
MPRDTNSLRCSFCGKSRDQVQRLFAGPTVYICNECVAACNEILADDQLLKEKEAGAQLPVSLSPDDEPTISMSCSLCHTLTRANECIPIPERGQLCRSCMGAVLHAWPMARP